MKKTIVRILSVIFVIALTAALLWKANDFFEYKQSSAKCDDFFESPKDYDIWFFGTSHGVMGYLPMELWDEYHMTSYSFANYGQWIPTDYWVLRLALEYHTPKMIVIDTFNYNYDEKFSDIHLSYLHETFDAFPYSRLKKEAISDILPRELQTDYLLPFSVNHSQWNNITRSNFQEGKEQFTYGKGSDESALNGTPSDVLVQPYADLGPTDITEKMPVDSVGEEYLTKIIELCKSKNIEVLLTTIPYVANDTKVKLNNELYDIAKENDVLFYDGLNEDIVDPVTDMWDEGHLNSSGARKWTSKMGAFIADNYDIPRYDSGEMYDKWSAEYESYMDYKVAIATKRKTLEDYLMLIADKNLSKCIYVNGSADYDNSKEIFSLIQNLSPEKELTDLEKAFANGEDYVLVIGDSDTSLVPQLGDGEVPYIQVTLKNNKTNQIVDVADFAVENKGQKALRK